MNRLLLAAILSAVPLAGCDTGDEKALAGEALQDLNVNAHYTVESVRISSEKSTSLSASLRSEFDKLVGSKLDYAALERLAERVKSELHVPNVAVNVGKGAVPGQVVVDFEVPQQRPRPIDLNVAKFLYDSKLGWSGEGAGSAAIAGNTFAFGMISDASERIERFAGIKAKYVRQRLGTDRLRLRFEFDSYHDTWNGATIVASNNAGLYRSEQTFAPEMTLVIAEPLELDFGTSFSRYRPEQPGAKIESSNAVVTTLRYHRRWGSKHDVQERELNANYSLRAGLREFGTDADFTRQFTEAHYRFRRDHQTIEAGFLAGSVRGDAPLFEKFVMGNATTLRGWNKFDLDPLGGSHIVHGSVDYAFHWLQVFYDTGAIWDSPQEREQKQSIGTGFKAEGFQVAIAFPIRSGHVEPIFYAGLNF
ncbi:MAG TPA: BamA/TamA family outer membrane protein [Bryobacteraceae bacterium]|nr:BamA/TamA family outer membrane protein [Bryobacteraceae bacterium]